MGYHDDHILRRLVGSVAATRDEMTTEVCDPPPLAGHGCDDGQQMMVVMVGSSDGCDDGQQ